MSMTTGGQPSIGAPLQPDYPPLPTFGWLLLAGIGHVLVIPSPWTLTAAYRFMCRNVRLPDGRRLSFAGQPGDIWYVIIALPLIVFVPQIVTSVAKLPLAGALVLQLAVLILNTWLLLLITRWFVANVRSDDGRLSIRFTGGAAGFIGWQLLLFVSMFTIVGWAWVAKFFLRWMCRHVTGNMAFDFVGSGLSILWRTIVFGLVSSLIIPIPWMIRWFGNWYASQVTVTPTA